jgi:hypothetical protein
MLKGPVRFLPGLLSAKSGKRNENRGSNNDTTGTAPNDVNIHGNKAVLRLPHSVSQPRTSHPQPQPPKQKLSTTLAHIHRQQLLHEQQQQQLSQNAAHALYTGRRQDRMNHHLHDDDDDSTSSNAAEGYALEFDCGESVSSLNDSCFGGASVTGGYNIYPSTTMAEPNVTEQQQQSPMKQATSLVVGVVPSISGMSVSDHPSFDTEDISYFVHDVERPPMLSPLPLTHTNSNSIELVEENSLINAKDGRLRTMKPILTGTLSPKQKRHRSVRRNPPNNHTSTVLLVPSSTALTTSDSTGNGNHHPSNCSGNTVRSSAVQQPQKDTPSLMISTTSSESHHESQIVEMIAPNTTSTSTTTDTFNKQRTPLASSTSLCGKCHYYPPWLQRVPFWLKVLLFIGWILLLVAIIIAIIGGIVSSVHRNNSSNENNSASLNDYNNHHVYNDTITTDPTSNIFIEPNSTITMVSPTITPSVAPSNHRPKADKTNLRFR